MDRLVAPSHSLLAVFAHPDDESLASGGLIARCAREGTRVTLLCLTRGSLGLPGDPERQRQGDRRQAELTAAARELGIHDLIVRDYRNGFLRWEDGAAIEADVQAGIARARADLVLTFDDDGLYWHPDHLAVHERVTAAVAALGVSAPALFYVSMPRGAMRAAWRAAADAGAGAVPETALGVEVDAFGLYTTPPTLEIDVRADAVTKLRALRCHRSQLAGDVLDRLPESAAPDVLGRELYRRADAGAPGETWLDRMGKALPGTEAQGEAVR